MDDNILVGIIVGSTVASSTYVWNNNSFTKGQKIGLLVCIIFPPAQWLGILILLGYNNYIESNSTEKVSERKVNETITKLDYTISNLKELKEKGILTDEEYKTKVEKIEAEKAEQNLKNLIEYKQLKSLFDSGILTKVEFEDKIQLLQKSSEELVTNDKSDTYNIFYKIDNVSYTMNSLKICHKKGTITFFKNTIVELEDGTAKKLENINELLFLLKRT